MTRIVVPRIPAPDDTKRYDYENESQFRQSVEGVLRRLSELISTEETAGTYYTITEVDALFAAFSFSDLSDYPADASGALTNDGVGGLSWVAAGSSGNLDGGTPSTIYGGTSPIDGGTP